MIQIEKLVVGQLSTNCYLIFDDKSREAIIIDPGDDADYILRKISDLKLNPLLIIATHGHFDHILGVTELKLAINVPFLINDKDLFLVKQAKSSAKYFLKIDIDPIILPDKFIIEGDVIKFENQKIKIMETPGHTPGSICLTNTNKTIIFTGDTLFAAGVGRTDFSYSSKEDMEKSFKKIQKLPKQAIIYPGHGEIEALHPRGEIALHLRI